MTIRDADIHDPSGRSQVAGCRRISGPALQVFFRLAVIAEPFRICYYMCILSGVWHMPTFLSASFVRPRLSVPFADARPSGLVRRVRFDRYHPTIPFE